MKKTELSKNPWGLYHFDSIMEIRRGTEGSRDSMVDKVSVGLIGLGLGGSYSRIRKCHKNYRIDIEKL
ncbi:hypothetical protein [Anaerosolibacter sp.]|uniref:hypothetical protein n=1 Tax=Anaerosolibacter sp. TaxID=1872527 RepID=UPI0039EFFFBF